MEVDLFIVRNANSGNQGDRLIYLSGLNWSLVNYFRRATSDDASKCDVG